MAMNAQRTWGFIRWVYFAVGAVSGVVAALAFTAPDGMSISPWLAALIAVLVLSVPLFASDALLQRVHRIFWRREWPK